jgi:hypothetical protein
MSVGGADGGVGVGRGGKIELRAGQCGKMGLVVVANKYKYGSSSSNIKLYNSNS